MCIRDSADLADMMSWAAADLSADFVLVNPLHAGEPVAPMEPSPYLPTSRRFVNPIYIRVEDIPEMGYMSSAERQLLEWHADCLLYTSPSPRDRTRYRMPS